MKDIRCVVFDIDGTLVRNAWSSHILPEVYRHLSHRLGIDNREARRLIADVQKKHAGGVDEWNWDLIFNEAGVHIEPLDLVNKHRKEIKLFPDVRPALCLLKKRLRLCAVSNGFKKFIDPEVEETELSQYLERVFCADQVRYAKPDPRIFSVTLRQMGVSVRETAFVGDNPSVDLPASELGIFVVLINRYRRAVPRGLEPNAVIHSLEELDELL